uniref:Uncharacterized protein n=2 Tax=Trieres chinensis TaxID=1514140 RepID=A0A7S1ZUM6_TRICV|mmetsp:Transcript_33309/g.67969  ORF Transcript_33309/g.67969 Transcript_33309/m.67969 type:complete len:262 (+) Transcript_33309:108-893(+)|eukprot:CAMPEP_0183327128 /NCGR_PEP_ID=MMETSP0160_2-20130417/83602_1 /TAXON_ID=2839 ORGANISM="Odontella Sinensis, Strain Grunow 1884" /NCGR_SAMPLE_ID=MMETSP0160_2 /ASSEMBLY_ACC=CAM_ASM_000250 /LENGTH=261 /DNA_ID=CAMNT_0025495243 /DNA_START=447 /DNA_END=1232 /DNA_ORIENTATION=-
MATLAVVLAFSVLVDIGHAFVAKPSGFAQKSKSTNCRNFFSLSSTSGIKRSSTSLGYRNLPSLEQVSNDPFSEQIYHASEIMSILKSNQEIVSKAQDKSFLESEEEQMISELMCAQFSHPDGIRGFFTTYLTGEGDALADMEDVPKPLRDAMKQANLEDLASLACMNVIVPIASMSKLSDSTLVANAAHTAERAKHILRNMRGSVNVIRNCAAIYIVAMGIGDKNPEGHNELILFWNDLFAASNFTDKQKEDIASAFTDLL